jgi:hypothetical protein
MKNISDQNRQKLKSGINRLKYILLVIKQIKNAWLLTPTKEKALHNSAGLYYLKQTQACLKLMIFPLHLYTQF